MTEKTQNALRDEFAIAAMPHMNWLRDTMLEAAEGCYLIADAMMAARGKNAPQEAGPWYPDDGGEWVEVPDDSMQMPSDLPGGGETRLLAMFRSERDRRSFCSEDYSARSFVWALHANDPSRIVAYRIAQ